MYVKNFTPVTRGWIKGLKTDYRLLWRVYKNNLPLIFDNCREQNGRLFGF